MATRLRRNQNCSLGSAVAAALAIFMGVASAQDTASPAPTSPAAPATATPTTVPAPSGPVVVDPAAPATPPLEVVTITAPEPRYVAPTLRDRIGRIWAPVYLNGKGPFRLVLDTGANRSAVIPKVAEALGESARTNRKIRVRGVTGTAEVPVLRVDRMDIGDLVLEPAFLPVVPDVFGGAEGVLGNEGMRDKRIFIDFKRDTITVKRSKREVPGPGFQTLPITIMRDYLLAVDVTVGRVKVKAVLDTGAPQSLGNVALQEALKRDPLAIPPEEVVGVTLDIEKANRVMLPTMYLQNLSIRGAAMSFADVHIFRHWKLTSEPAILLGMDVLGVVEQLIIDYRTRQLHIKTRR
jgi:predicted aspartyl protease